MSSSEPMGLSNDARLESFIFEGDQDMRRRSHKIGYFLNEFMQLELRDRAVIVSIDYFEEAGDVAVRAEKLGPDGFGITFYTNRKKVYELESKTDVLTWVAEVIKGMKRRYQEMPELSFQR